MTPSDLAKEISRDMNLKIEQHLRLCIKPKPHWLPHAAWRWLLQRLVVVEMTSPKFTEIR